MKRKTILRIFAGLLGFALIFFVLATANSALGNPISAMLAGRAARAHVAETYPGLDAEFERAVYDFKFGEYIVRVRSKTSPDTRFTLYCRRGEVRYDDYELRVGERRNTLDRLGEEYTTHVTPLVEGVGGLTAERITVFLEKSESTPPEVVLDMPFSKDLPLDYELMIGGAIDEATLARCAEILTELHQTMLKNNCRFSLYTLTLEGEGRSITVSGATPAQIESGELAALLERAAEQREPGTVDAKEADAPPPELVVHIREQ
ncbi:hypothetical protein [Feifania hominis]|uniref:Uncharacterized protein n=1 Tax=Feifania hominis TaxID=2763660 RepID=A0A926DG92_9FIRM|nr:hypothetical protein [Feifania hominis]MBC8536744.1 hypothetical protein [Feifania hominis]